MEICESCGAKIPDPTRMITRDGQPHCCETCADGHSCLLPCARCVSREAFQYALDLTARDVQDGHLSRANASCSHARYVKDARGTVYGVPLV